MSRRSEDMSLEMPQQPIVVVASLLSFGCLAGWLVMLGVWEMAVAWAAVLAGVCCVRRWWMTYVVLFCVGFSVTQLHRALQGSLEGEGYYAVRVEQVAKGDRRGVLRVESRLDEQCDVWRVAGGEVRYGVRDSLSIERGDRAVVWCRVSEFRGRFYTLLSDRSVVSVDGGEAMSREGSDGWSGAVNGWAARRVESLGLSDEVESIVMAMLLGRGEELSAELKREYRRSGAAHVLALSGLHVMIVYVVLSRLLLLLNIVPFGFRLRPLLCGCAVWFYAEVVGMTPSVERAAMMFVMMQVLWFFSRQYRSFMGLVVAATLMLLFDPSVAFDVGFMLSVVAVGAILMWVVPLDRRFGGWCRARFERWAFVGWLVRRGGAIALVGVVCSVATLPIVSWSFGYLSLMGVVLNPLVFVTAYFILLFSLVWVIFGFGAVAPIFCWAIDGLGRLQCEAVDYMSSGWRDAVDVRISGWSVWAIYLLYSVLTVVVWAAPSGRGDGASDDINENETPSKLNN